MECSPLLFETELELEMNDKAKNAVKCQKYFQQELGRNRSINAYIVERDQNTVASKITGIVVIINLSKAKRK